MRYFDDDVLRPAALVVGIGSLVAVTIGIATATVSPELAKPGTGGFALAGVILTLAHLAVLSGIAILAASPAARPGRLKSIGFASALAGLASQTLGEALIRVDMSLGNVFFSACMPLMGIGMIMVGIAVIRTGTWSGWRRFAPISCGLYIPVVLIPAFVIARGPSFVALAGFAAVYALLGLAMYGESSPSAEASALGAV